MSSTQSAAARYKAAQIGSVTLTTGDVIQVRRMDRADFFALGGVPDLFHDPELRRGVKDRSPEAIAKIVEKESGYLERFQRQCLLHCIVSSNFKVVDKPSEQCGEDEVPYHAVNDVDKAAIVNKISELAGGGKEVAEQARTFPEKQEAAA